MIRNRRRRCLASLNDVSVNKFNAFPFSKLPMYMISRSCLQQGMACIVCGIHCRTLCTTWKQDETRHAPILAWRSNGGAWLPATLPTCHWMEQCHQDGDDLDVQDLKKKLRNIGTSLDTPFYLRARPPSPGKLVMTRNLVQYL